MKRQRKWNNMNITDKEWVSDVNKNFIEKVAPIIFNKACEQHLDDYNNGKISFDEMKSNINKVSEGLFKKSFITEKSFEEFRRHYNKEINNHE
jgi:hypothetical protein